MEALVVTCSTAYQTTDNGKVVLSDEQKVEFLRLWYADVFMSDIASAMKLSRSTINRIAYDEMELPHRGLIHSNFKTPLDPAHKPNRSKRGDQRGLHADKPLPPGHPITWGIICQGTSLEGVPFGG